ncbi:hypothetical protein ABIB57_001784 [Devosia sp. UYZn731]|uniref:hypothetical protein n=1 Tax=Devosia sp. UYZn731 TaxID=3156345 RepID=UPI00339A77B3
MTRFLSILALIMALVALSAPSVSLGAGVRGPLWTSIPSDSAVSGPASDRIVVGCHLVGGKRLLPCHPDLGVMVTTVSTVRPSIGHHLARAMMPPLTAATPEAELPPPRLG